jgi:hypothetical protein
VQFSHPTDPLAARLKPGKELQGWFTDPFLASRFLSYFSLLLQQQVIRIYLLIRSFSGKIPYIQWAKPPDIIHSFLLEYDVLNLSLLLAYVLY